MNEDVGCQVLARCILKRGKGKEKRRMEKEKGREGRAYHITAPVDGESLSSKRRGKQTETNK